jgi:4a-hydroxytetrahydrobiopterin dehydratase
MVSVKDITPSANEDPETLATQTTDLVDKGQWRLCNEGKGLERVLKFKTFKTTWVNPSILANISVF